MSAAHAMWDADWPTSAAGVVVALVIVHVVFRATSPKARRLACPTDDEVYGESGTHHWRFMACMHVLSHVQ